MALVPIASRVVSYLPWVFIIVDELRRFRPDGPTTCRKKMTTTLETTVMSLSSSCSEGKSSSGRPWPSVSTIGKPQGNHRKMVVSWDFMGCYPLVNVNKKRTGKIHHAIKRGKPAISMVIFKSYVTVITRE